jgi:hypothetical protein
VISIDWIIGHQDIDDLAVLVDRLVRETDHPATLTDGWAARRAACGGGLFPCGAPPP